MIDHIYLPVSDLKRSSEFYKKVLEPLGIDMPYEVGQPPIRGFAINNIPGAGSSIRFTRPSASRRSTNWVTFERTQVSFSASSLRLIGWSWITKKDSAACFAPDSFTPANASSSRASTRRPACISAKPIASFIYE